MQSKVVLIFGKNVWGLVPSGGHGAGTFWHINISARNEWTDIGGRPPRVVIPLLCPGVWNAISECWEIVLKLFLRWQFWWSLLKPLDYGWTPMKDSLFYGHLSLYKLKPLVFICWPRIGRYIGYLRGGLAEIFPIIWALEFRNLGDW